SEAWTHFKDLLQKVPHNGIDLWLQVQIFYDQVNPDTRRTIDQLARGKLSARNAKESWALLDDLALYDNEMNKIASSCKIYSGPYDTQYCMENPEQAFVDYASLRIDEAGGLVSSFMASQDARLSNFEADFKQQQGRMTNKMDTFLKAINDRMTGALPRDPQCSSHPLNSINAIKTCSSQASNLQKDQLKTVNKIRTSKPKEHAKALEDEFKDLHLNLPVLEVLCNTPIIHIAAEANMGYYFMNQQS
ncbi:hypothetical protein Tco_1179142, partial [Tanacetum coccineum]